MKLHRFLMLIVSVTIALLAVVQAETFGKYPPAAAPHGKPLPESLPVNPSQFPREKKWSLYLIPDPPYGRGPYPVPTYHQYPYSHPQYVLERNSYPSDDFQFYYY